MDPGHARVAAVSVPALAGLAIVADDSVNLGSAQVAEPTTVIQVLAWVGAPLQPLQSLNTGNIEALGHARAIFRWTISGSCSSSHLVAFVVGLQAGGS